MSKFTGSLSITYLPDGRYAVLNQNLVWEEDHLGSGKTIVVPAGFVSDGASVPRLMWFLMPPWGDKGTRAAILHDYLLSIDHPAPHAQFYLALQATGVVPWRACLLYAAVSLWDLKRKLLDPI